jgi:hypothetical protein
MSVLKRRHLLLGALAFGAYASLPAHVIARGIAGDPGEVAAPPPDVMAPPPLPPRDLLYAPVNYGYQDYTLSLTGFGVRKARIYFPSFGTTPSTAAIRSGRYPLVVFCHGQRDPKDGLCPPNPSLDYARWTPLLRLLARCGFVVMAPNMDGIYSAEPLEQYIAWMTSSSPYRDSLMSDAGTNSDGSTPPQHLALIGHSWGTKSIGHLLSRNIVTPRCIAFTNGSWVGAETEVRESSAPLLLIVASKDEVYDAQPDYTNSLFAPLRPFAFEAAIQGATHWGYSEIAHCNSPMPSDGPAAIASDLLVVFLHKYLYAGRFQLPSSLQTAIGTRPSLSRWYTDTSALALQVRWHDPLATPSYGIQGRRTRGFWVDPDPFR